MKALNTIANIVSRSLGLAAVLAVTAVSPLFAQQPNKSGGAVATNDKKVWIFDDKGNVVTELTLPGFPAVQSSPNGPTTIVTDQNGTKFYDSDGVQVGGEFKKTGKRQEVILDGDRVIVIDDDGVRIADLNGAQKGKNIPKTGNKRQKVITRNGRIIVVDSNGVRVYDKNGKPLGGSIPTDGYPDVIFTGKRLIIRDGSGVGIYDKSGKLKKKFTPKHIGQWQVIDDERYVVLTDDAVQVYDEDGLTRGVEFRKTGKAKQQVIVCGGRVIVIDDDRVRILSREGQQLTGVNTSGPRATVKTTKDRIIITDDQSTRTFSKVDARLILSVATTSQQRQYVVTESDRLIVTDEDQTRIYNSNGDLQGQPIMRSGMDTQRVYTNGDRIGVVDTNKVRLFDLGGNQVGQDIGYKDDLELGLQMFDSAITVSDFNQVRIFNRNGAQQGNAINVSLGLQHIQMAGDQILVTHDNFFRIYRTDGTQVGQTHAVGFDPEITPRAYYGGSFTPVGVECSDAQGGAGGKPWIGGEINLDLGNAPSGTMAQLNLGLSNTNWGGFGLPFSLDNFGAPGCTVYNDAVIALGARVNDNGFAKIVIPVPNDLNLVGFTFYSQWLMLAPGANTLGVLLSDGMEIRIGSGY